MCLFSKKRTPLLATEDITCYKVLEITGAGYRTPFQSVKVNIPSVLYAMNFGEKLEYDLQDNVFIVEGQGVHAYVEKEIALNRATFLQYSFDDCETVIARCTIPEGTAYWLGLKGDIAAREMLIEKIVD